MKEMQAEDDKLEQTVDLMSEVLLMRGRVEEADRKEKTSPSQDKRGEKDGQVKKRKRKEKGEKSQAEKKREEKRKRLGEA